MLLEQTRTDKPAHRARLT